MWLLAIGLSVVQAETDIPAPVYVVEKSTASAKGWQIERMTGCYGDLKEARGHVKSAEDLLSAPVYQTSSYTKGTFALTKPTCVLGDQPEVKATFTDFVMDFENYLYNHVYECGCGTCYTLDPNAEYGVGEEFGEDEVLEHVTDQHKKDFEAYKSRRTSEVAANKVQYDLYSKEYDAWTKQFKAEIHDESVRISITPEQDLAGGTATLFSYRWEQDLWCGDLQNANRFGLDYQKVRLPDVEKGQTVHIWLHNVDSQLTWGAVLNQTETIDELMQPLQLEPMQLMEQGVIKDDLYSLPSSWDGRSIQLSPGSSSRMSNDCCAC